MSKEEKGYEIIKDEKFAALRFSKDKLTSVCSPSVKADVLVLNEKDGYTSFIFDLKNTKYCDSSGLSAILVANRIANEGNGCLVLCGLQEAVENLIKISQLEGILNIVPSYNEAIDFIFMEELERGLEDLD